VSMSDPAGSIRRKLAIPAIIALALVVAACTPLTEATPSAGASGPAQSASISLGGAEQKVLAVLEVIDRTGEAPEGYRGGTQFMNDGRGGGQVLPGTDAAGRPITYREWDVNPYTGANRGTERLVTGSDGSAWYTNDHYDTFVRIR
jgi:guanyl-specific ribonuclease Sa